MALALVLGLARVVVRRAFVRVVAGVAAVNA